jgi:hypothetical protein
MSRVVFVYLLSLSFVFPLNNIGVLDAMCGDTGCLSNSTHGESLLRRQRSFSTLIASTGERLNDTSLSSKTFSTTIDHDDLSFFVGITLLIEFHELVYNLIDKRSGLDVVKTADNDLELLVKFRSKILNHFFIVTHLNSGAPIHDEFSSNL